MNSIPQAGLGTGVFAAALDAVAVGKITDGIDPAPIVTAYVDSISAGSYSLSAHRVTAEGAASLLELIRRSAPDLLSKILYPIDVRAKLVSDLEENPYTIADTVARSLRAHIRVLCRAVTGSTDFVPADLLDALVIAVRSAALKHDEKGRVAAFSPRYETNGISRLMDRAIAADLGAALNACTDEQKDKLLTAILETDEPMVLAQLMSFAPHANRTRIQKRISELTPIVAGGILSLTEAQARIDALLAAGLGDTASRFIEAEQDLTTLGKVPGREVERLRSKLRLQLVRGEWSAIAATELPAGLSVAEQPSAKDTINFFKALAGLKNPEGDRQQSEQILIELHRRRPDISTYSVNLIAARISQLLGDDSLRRLEGSDAIRGRQILNEADQIMSQKQSVPSADMDVVNGNRAVLLMALGEPEQAYELLRPMRARGLRDNAEAYAAIAIAMMGRVSEAAAILARAEKEIGSTDVLRAARAHRGWEAVLCVRGSINGRRYIAENQICAI